MRVAIVTESFFPQVNGVTNTVRHIVDRLLELGHEALVIAPGPGLVVYRTARVVRVRSIAMPGYRSFPVGLPDVAVEQALAEFRPDVVHLASPIALGAVARLEAEGAPPELIERFKVALRSANRMKRLIDDLQNCNSTTLRGVRCMGGLDWTCSPAPPRSN